MTADDAVMDRALALGRRGLGRTSPNPAVGCVITAVDGRVIGEGFHQRAGGPHAEVAALASLSESAVGATATVTLEPCNHQGRTGPCTEALIAAGLSRVVVGCTDPNPKVAGGGIQRLRQAGIRVDTGIREADCRELIAPFVTWATTGRPLVILKVATTLDGRIGTKTGHSKWVTGPKAREDVHRLRDRCDAILVGQGTVLADDPALTTRLPEGEGTDPMRVVLAGDPAGLPQGARVLSRQPDAPPTLVVVPTDSGAAGRLRARGVEVHVAGGAGEEVSLHAVLDELGRRDVTSLLVEGGRGVASSFLRAGLVDRLHVYLAPKVLGEDGLGWAGALGFRTMDEVIGLSHVRVRQLGEDVCIEGTCVYRNR